MPTRFDAKDLQEHVIDPLHETLRRAVRSFNHKILQLNYGGLAIIWAFGKQVSGFALDSRLVLAAILLIVGLALDLVEHAIFLWVFATKRTFLKQVSLGQKDILEKTQATIDRRSHVYIDDKEDKWFAGFLAVRVLILVIAYLLIFRYFLLLLTTAH
jgi:hypothetical protein